MTTKWLLFCVYEEWMPICQFGFILTLVYKEKMIVDIFDTQHLLFLLLVINPQFDSGESNPSLVLTSHISVQKSPVFFLKIF